MKISILTPSYNSGKYLERAIKSVLDQGYKNWEHIIVDGGSKDDTIEIIAKYPHLICVSEPDEGQSDAMNKAFAKSTGEIIVYLNADDYFKEGAFSVVIDSFERNSDAEMVVGDLEIVYHNFSSELKSPSTSLEDILVYNKLSFPLNPVSYFYKRHVQGNIGLFPIHNHYSMDYWFLIRAYKYAKIIKLDFVTGCFFTDGNNKSTNYVESNMSVYDTWKEFSSILNIEDFGQIQRDIVCNYVKFIHELIVKLKASEHKANLLNIELEVVSNQNKLLNSHLKKIEATIFWRVKKLIKYIFLLKK